MALVFLIEMLSSVLHAAPAEGSARIGPSSFRVAILPRQFERDSSLGVAELTADVVSPIRRASRPTAPPGVRHGFGRVTDAGFLALNEAWMGASYNGIL
jgi:hypothetical protein